MDIPPQLCSNGPMNREISKLGGLFSSFFRISAFTLGGGAVMLPLMEEEFHKKRQWITKEDMLDVYTLCQSLPGVIGINSSLMIGRMTAGLAGAVAAVLGVLLPSVLMITALASVIQLISRFELVILAFRGVRAGVTALLLFVIIELGSKVLRGFGEIFIAVLAFISLEVLGINAILVVLLSALFGWILFRKRDRA